MTRDEALRLAVDHHRAGRLDPAAALYRAILAATPRDAATRANLGLILKAQGRLDDAVACLRQALEHNPALAGVWANLGRAERDAGRPVPAAAAFRLALVLAPDDAGTHAMASNLLREAGRPDEAAAAARRAAALAPGAPGARVNLGVALRALHRTGDAVAAFRTATALAPADLAALNGLAGARRDQGAAGDAVLWSGRAHALDPTRPEPLGVLAGALLDQGVIDAAADACRRASELHPAAARLHQTLLMVLLYHPDVRPARLEEEHRAFDARYARPLAPAVTAHANPPDPARRLTVGYVSADFRHHPVSRFFEPLLAAHDRTGIRALCYCATAAPDAVTGRLRGLADGWRPVAGVDDATLARMIREDGVDVLVDLAGHTAGNRLLAFARRPAPVQVSWLGYPADTGLSAISHRLVDSTTDPEDGDARVVRLPRGFLCYGPPGDAPAVTPLPALAAGRVTFGSFNNLNKVNPAVIALWASVLHRVPGSRLLLKSRPLADPHTARMVRDRFATHGIAADRLELRGWTESAQAHLAAYGAVDIALDTFPYGGTTTTCDALWMGVPVVTLRGDRHAARVGASLLARLGLDGLAADTAPAFAAAAAGLAGDLPALERLRAGLRARMAASPLCDAHGFARQMEDAYRALWAGWCAGPLRHPDD